MSECGLDLVQLLLGGFGIDDIEHAPLAAALLHRVEDLRDATVQGVSQQFAGMAAARPPI